MQSRERNNQHSKWEQELRHSRNTGEDVSRQAFERGQVQLRSLESGLRQGIIRNPETRAVARELDKVHRNGRSLVEAHLDRTDCRTLTQTTRQVYSEIGYGQGAGVRMRSDGLADGRSAMVRGGELRFCQDGTVDMRCEAVRSGAVRLRDDGQVDGRSWACRASNFADSDSD